jgi:biopolymer transport protein TolQ
LDFRNTAALLLQSSPGDVLSLLGQTSFTAKIVLVILLLFSIGSWGIILSKTLLLRKVRRESETFWRIFRKGQSFSEIGTALESLRFTPLVAVFNAGAEVLAPSGAATGRAHSGNLGVAVRTAPVSVNAVQRALQRSSSAQLTLLESRLTFLATTASVAPFIGLFGTVWGVLVTFTGLAQSNVTTLRAVAPGIADALIATAFGLFTAIPALIAYNHFVYQIRNIGGQLDDLQVDMLAIAEGNGL